MSINFKFIFLKLDDMGYSYGNEEKEFKILSAPSDFAIANNAQFSSSSYITTARLGAGSFWVAGDCEVMFNEGEYTANCASADYFYSNDGIVADSGTMGIRPCIQYSVN